MNDFKKNKLYDYQPSNLNDHKMPKLEKDIVVSNNINKESKNEHNSDEVVSNKLDNSKAKELIANIKKQAELSHEESDNNPEQSKLVMPDPNSNDRLIKYGSYKVAYEAKVPDYRNSQKIVKDSKKEARENLQKKDIDVIVNTFKHKVIKINKTEVVIKNNKYGFEFYKNSFDRRWWVTAIVFDEIWNPKKEAYLSLWSGNAFVGYGENTLDEVISRAHTLTTSGRTGNIVWRDFVISWNEQNNRFLAGDKPTQFTFKEYQKIIKWWDANKIRIHVKQEKIKDYEDLMNETKLKKAKGEFVSPMVAIQAKLLDPPRKAKYIFGYPVKKKDYKGKDYANPENKLYEIGFAFNE